MLEGDAWRALVARYDADGDGRILPAEHGRGEAAFQFLDRDHDGVLTEVDFEVLGRQSRGLPAGAFVRVGGPLARCADIDDDAVVARADWDDLLDRLSIGADIDRQQLAGLGLEANRLPMMVQMLDVDRDQVLTRAELDAMFDKLDADGDGRIAGVEFGIDDMPQGPRAGELAPDFDLPLVDDPSQTLRLSAFRGQRPVALIFGSYT